MLLATYVDNVMIFGRDARGAEASLAELKAFLTRAWRLDLPAGSTEILVPHGAPVRPPGEHKVVERMRFLGHVIDSTPAAPSSRAGGMHAASFTRGHRQR